jgi:PadR family transcriptional regulator, regulatory protein PadR
MKRQDPSLGEFEQSVLLAIAHLGEAAYGVSIRHEIEARSGREISIGALYTAIDRLERKGYVQSKLSEPRPERGGRSKRFVQLTPAGAAALRRSRELMDRMWAGLTPGRLRPARQR